MEQQPRKVQLTTDYILSHIQPRLLSSEHHAERLSSLIKRHISADIWLTWCVDMTPHPDLSSISPDYTSSIPVTYDFARQLGVTTDDLESLGESYCSNTYSVMPIQSMLKELCVSQDNSVIDAPDVGTPNMFVITNANTHFGAAAILDKSIQHYLNAVFPTGCYLLPSSIHDFLAVAGDTEDAHNLAHMVQTINHDVVAPEEILSDHIFTFDN